MNIIVQLQLTNVKEEKYYFLCSPNQRKFELCYGLLLYLLKDDKNPKPSKKSIELQLFCAAFLFAERINGQNERPKDFSVPSKFAHFREMEIEIIVFILRAIQLNSFN